METLPGFWDVLRDFWGFTGETPVSFFGVGGFLLGSDTGSGFWDPLEGCSSFWEQLPHDLSTSNTNPQPHRPR